MIHYYHSDMQGAPTLAGVAGSMIGLLDAVLVNGFGQLSVASISVASGIATVTFGAGHQYGAQSVIEIAGATPAGLNGKQKVLSVLPSALTFAAPSVPDGTAAGTITARMPALGYTKVFSGSNKAVYKSAAPQALASGHLRIDDTDAMVVRARGFEAMTDVDTGTGPFPTTATIGGSGGYWPKSYQAGATTRPWMLVGDGQAFWLQVTCGANPFTGWCVYFGDIARENSTDQFATGIYCSVSDLNNYNSDSMLGGDISGSCAGPQASITFTSAGVVSMPRDYHGLGAAVLHHVFAESITQGGGLPSGRSGLAWPNPVSNRLRFGRVMVATNNSIRGSMPGLWHIAHNVSGAFPFSNRDVLSPLDGPLQGRQLLAVRTGYTAAQQINGGAVSFLDLTGPWR